MDTIGVLIVEDQAMLRESLVSTIDSQPDMHVVASLADAAEAPAFVAGAASTSPSWTSAPRMTRAA